MSTKAYFIHVIPALKARFIADPKQGKAPLVVKFSDLSDRKPGNMELEFR